VADICPEKIVPSGSIPVLSSYRIANLKGILWNVRNPILFRMLVCKEEKILGTDGCPYPDHINTKATKKKGCDSKDKLAHIYFRHSFIDKKARSCVVIFTEGDSLHTKIDMLFDIYQNTVNFLNIATERPYFYIIIFGDPIFDNDYNSAHKMLEHKMKTISQNEDIFFIIYANKNAEVLNVTHTTKFSVRVQENWDVVKHSAFK
jgi:hypothetical protein